MCAMCQLVWREGDLLTPPHLQLLNAYVAELARQAERSAHPYYWGVEYTVDEPAFQRGTFKIDRCDVVMTDGTHLRVQGPPPSSNTRIPARDFTAALEAHGKGLVISLGLKPVPWIEPLYTHYASCVEESEVTDLYAADNRYPVPYLVYDAQLLFDNELEQYRDWTVLKIAVVRRASHDASFYLDDQDIPPCRSIHASAVLTKLVESIRDQLQRKAREYEGYKQDRAFQVIGMGRRAVLYFRLMPVLYRYHQALQHALEARATHPHEVYGVLRQLVGELSTFSSRFSVLDTPLPPYQHDRLWECFEPTTQVVTQRLHEISGGSAHEVPLAYERASKSYTAEIPEGFFARHSRYYLAIKTDMVQNDLEQTLNKKCKISAREDLPELKACALDGIKVQIQMPPPQELPYRSHYVYVYITPHQDLWHHVEQRKNLVVYCGDNTLPEDTEIILYSVPATEE
jgi:type VI secretion system protein ImpJ